MALGHPDARTPVVDFGAHGGVACVVEVQVSLLMKSLRMLPLLLTLAGCAARIEQEGPLVWGMKRPATHEVSVAELLGNSTFFDGEPVSLVGYASFDLSFEGKSAIYLSEDDAKYETPGRIDVGFGADGPKRKGELEALSGKFVRIEGIFRSWSREKLRNDSRLRICVPECPAAGRIIEVNRVTEILARGSEG